MRSAKTHTERCSFCHKAEDVVERLIPSPSDRNVRICDECLAVCNSILSDVGYPPASPTLPDHRGHRWMCDPRTPDLLNTIEQWVIAESQHRHLTSRLRPNETCRFNGVPETCISISKYERTCETWPA